MPRNDGWRVSGYTDVARLGDGRSGHTVVARDDATGGLVAVKYLAPGLAGRPEFRARFRSEVGLLRQLAHPNVARVLRYVESAAGAAVVMELIEGPSLRRILGFGRPMPVEAALAVLRGSLQGLAAAHRLGVVHRDYAPGNVVVRADGSSVLVDFGIAVPVGAADPTIEGTPWYMAPEQWSGRSVGPATDVYAATAVFHHCLTTRPPYLYDRLDQLARAHGAAPIPSVDAPPAVRDLLARGLAKDPADRPASAGAFLVELDAAAGRALGPDWESRGRAVLAAAVATGAAGLVGPPGNPYDGSVDSRADPSTSDPGARSADSPAPEVLAPGSPAPGSPAPEGPADGFGTAAGAPAQPATSGGPAHVTRSDGSAPEGGPSGQPDAAGAQAGHAAGPRPESARVADVQGAPSGDLGAAVSRAADGGARSGAGGRQSAITRLAPKTRNGKYALAAGAGLGAAAVVIAVAVVVREPEVIAPQAATPPTPPAPTIVDGPPATTGLAFVQDDTLFALSDSIAHPIRPYPADSYPSSIDFSADGEWLVGTDADTVFAWNGPGATPVERPCAGCTAAYVDGPDGGRVAVVEDGQVRRLDPATLDGGDPVALQLPDVGPLPIVQGDVGELLLVSQPRAEPSAYGGPDTLWLVDPVSGAVHAEHDSADNVAISDVVVSADGGRVAFTSYSHGGACYETGRVTVLDGPDLSPVEQPDVPIPDVDTLAVDDVFFNGDRAYAVMSGYDESATCEQVVPPALYRLEAGEWQPAPGPPLSAIRPLEGLAGAGTGSFVVEPDGAAYLRFDPAGSGGDPLALPGPIDPGRVWSTPTGTEVGLD